MNERLQVRVGKFLDVLSPEEGAGVVESLKAHPAFSKNHEVDVAFALLENAVRTMSVTIGRIETKEGDAALLVIMMGYEKIEPAGKKLDTDERVLSLLN